VQCRYLQGQKIKEGSYSLYYIYRIPCLPHAPNICLSFCHLSLSLFLSLLTLPQFRQTYIVGFVQKCVCISTCVIQRRVEVVS
jgi:hypothetical protein